MLKKKIAQMLLMGLKGTEVKPDDLVVRAIENQQLGGVILFENNIIDPSQLGRLTRQLQEIGKKKSSVPLLIGIDYEGGTVIRLTEQAGFPQTLSAQAISDLPSEEIKKHASQMARTLMQAGINLNFAPCVDVNVNPNNPIIGKRQRSFSSAYQTVIHCAAIFSEAHRKQHIITVFKHFPGHGSSTGDTHKGYVDITDTWKEEELEPYKQLLKTSTNCSMIMTGHLIHRKLDEQAYPASLSHAMTTGLLRDTLRFDGVVVTDDMQMGAIREHYDVAQAVRLAINAGADILVFGNQLTTPQDPEQVIEMIYADVLAGKIAESQIDNAYQRIMTLKDSLLFSR